MASKWLSTGQAAKKLGMTPRGVRKACQAGAIPGVACSARGQWRVPSNVVELALRQKAATLAKKTGTSGTSGTTGTSLEL